MTPATPPPPAQPRDHYRAFRSIGTRWSDNDVYGHVNNVVYYSWFDTAVNAWLIEQGALENPAPDAIFGLHNTPGVPAGTTIIDCCECLGAVASVLPMKM